MKTLTTLYLFPFFLFLFTANAVGQTTYTWTGATDTDWSTTSNWSPTGSPSSSDYIVIESGTYDLQLTAEQVIERFKINSGVMDLNDFTLTVNDKLELLGGTITAGRIVQDASNIANINGATVNCKLDLTATTVTAQYSDFADSVAVHQTTTSGTIYWRGNRFYGPLEIENTSNGNMNLGYNPADSCFAGLTLRGGQIRAGYAHPGYYIQGNLVIDDQGTSGTYFAISGGDGTAEVTVDGDIILDKTGDGSLSFAVTSGTCQLNQTSGHSIYEGSTGYTTGYHKIMGLIQAGTGGGLSYVAGAATQEFYLEVGANGPSIGGLALDLDDVTIDSANVKGIANVTAEHLRVLDSRFEDITSFTKTGNVNDTIAGNVFESDLSLTLGASSAPIRLSVDANDTIYGDLTATSYHQNLILAYNAHAVVHGDVTCNEQGGDVICGNASGTARFVFAGTGDQQMNLGASGEVEVKRLRIDKPSGRVLLMDSMTVLKGLYLTEGIIECRNNAVVTLADEVEPSGSDDSYIEGAVTKIGDDAYTFPVGRNGHYRPIAISAPSSTTDAFTAVYFNEDSDPLYDHDSKESSINEIGTNEYWLLDRTTGTSNVSVTLSWDDMSCGFDTLANLRVVGWDTSAEEWKDLGNGGTTGDTDEGTVVSSSAVTIYEAFTLATVDTFDCVPCRADAGQDWAVTVGYSVLIGGDEISGLSYSWTPTTYLDNGTLANPRAEAVEDVYYKLTTTNSNGCEATDEMYYTVGRPPGLNGCMH